MIISTALKAGGRFFSVFALITLAACQTGGTDKEATASILSSTNAAKPKSYALRGDTRPYASLIAKHAANNGVPVDLAHAVVFSESTYRPRATGAAGEIGLMQLKLSTARGVGYTGTREALYDPETNIKYGMRYLGQARKIGDGSTCATILRYNAGHAATRMNPISRAYCNKVTRLMAES